MIESAPSFCAVCQHRGHIADKCKFAVSKVKVNDGTEGTCEAAKVDRMRKGKGVLLGASTSIVIGAYTGGPARQIVIRSSQGKPDARVENNNIDLNLVLAEVAEGSLEEGEIQRLSAEDEVVLPIVGRVDAAESGCSLLGVEDADVSLPDGKLLVLEL